MTDSLVEKIAKQQKVIEAKNEALEFYADIENYESYGGTEVVLCDEGCTAQQALAINIDNVEDK